MKKATRKLNNEKNAVTDITSTEHEQPLDHILVTVSTQKVFSMKVAPGTTVDALTAELASKGYDVNNAEVSVMSDGEKSIISQNTYCLKNQDSITYETNQVKAKSFFHELFRTNKFDSELCGDVEEYKDNGNLSDDLCVMSQDKGASIRMIDDSVRRFLKENGIRKGEIRVRVINDVTSLIVSPGK